MAERYLVALCSPELRLGDAKNNANIVLEHVQMAKRDGCHMAVFPDMFLTGCTAGDYISGGDISHSLRDMREYLREEITPTGLACVIPFGRGKSPLVIGRAPFTYDIMYAGDPVPDGQKDVIICAGNTPRTLYAFEKKRSDLERLCGDTQQAVIYVSSGEGESACEFLYESHSLVCQYGEQTQESFLPYSIGALNTGIINRTFAIKAPFTPFEPEVSQRRPFVPVSEDFLKDAAYIQARGLSRYLKSTGMSRLMLNVSGGLDSTLALLAAADAMQDFGGKQTDIIGISQPGPGTTVRTDRNANRLMELLGIAVRRIDINEAVKRNLSELGHEGGYDTSFENVQARTRTMNLFNLANMMGAIAIGTGNMSEIALGFATYGGDHLSMYSVNHSVPKTLVRALVGYHARRYGGELGAVLMDIIDTPISPELVPSPSGEIEQKTEKIIGPYELHDFFLYHYTLGGLRAKEVLKKAQTLFGDDFSPEELEKYLRLYIRRFVGNGFKRACAAVGVSVLPVSLSPRSGIKSPADFPAAVLLEEYE